MTPVKDSSGKLLSLDTVVQQKNYKIDEALLIRALKLNPGMLGLDLTNCYLHPREESATALLAFQLHLSTACDSVIPPNLFSAPQKLAPIYFTAKAQFLSPIIKTNIMPHRREQLIEPCDPELMHYLLTGNISFGLPHFLLTSMLACYENDFIGYGLLLNKVI